MLKNLDPVLTPDLLQVLRAMGHGDEIVIVDANYPADPQGRRWCGSMESKRPARSMRCSA